jgi:uncharacterized protein with ParB-like and HNH nuclease domain
MSENNKIPFSEERVSLSQLLTNQRYSIHYYQREYKWQEEQISQLLSDLFSSFYSYYPSRGSSTVSVADFGYYFMGTVIVIQKSTGEQDQAIIDGQQRMTSFTLLILYLQNRLMDLGLNPRNDIEGLLRTNGRDNISFNDATRKEVIRAIRDRSPEIEGKSTSAIFMAARYRNIQRILDEELTQESIPVFFEWILGHVLFVKITVESEQEGCKMFVAMNDRGLVLNNAEMLKGFLLSNLTEEQIYDADECWKGFINELLKSGGADPEDPSNHADLDFFVDFLQAKYAVTYRQNGQSENGDYELIGSSFYNWVFENRTAKMGLSTADDYRYFIENRLPRYSSIYVRIRNWENAYTLGNGFEALYYNQNQRLSFQNLLMLSAIRGDDNDDVVYKKIKVVSYFVDFFGTLNGLSGHRRSWNYNRSTLFQLVKKLRDKSLSEVSFELVNFLNQECFSQDINLGKVRWLERNGANSHFIKYYLARLTEKTGLLCERTSPNFVALMNYSRKNGQPFDIEHIIADTYHLYPEFSRKDDFEKMRNNIGNLILIEYSVNRSQRDITIEEKMPNYKNQNDLARTLVWQDFPNDNHLRDFAQRYALTSYSKDFRGPDVNSRALFYWELSKEIWNVDYFEEIAGPFSPDQKEALSQSLQGAASESKIQQAHADHDYLLEGRPDHIKNLFVEVEEEARKHGYYPSFPNDYENFWLGGKRYRCIELHCTNDRVFMLVKRGKIPLEEGVSVKPDSFGWTLNCELDILQESDISRLWKYVEEGTNLVK